MVVASHAPPIPVPILTIGASSHGSHHPNASDPYLGRSPSFGAVFASYTQFINLQIYKLCIIMKSVLTRLGTTGRGRWGLSDDMKVDEGRGRGRDEGAVMRFVEHFALTISEAGVPRMPARVFSALLVSDEGRLTAAELAEALKVSPAAISNAVRYLIQVGLVAREREPGEQRDRYRVHGGDAWYEVTIRRDAMLLRWQEDLREGIEAVGADTPAGRRLEETRRFYQFVHEEMPRLLERWREVRSDSGSQKG